MILTSLSPSRMSKNLHELLTELRHGSQGGLLVASDGDLRNEFRSDDTDEIIKIILENGVLKSAKVCVFVLFMVSMVLQTSGKYDLLIVIPYQGRSQTRLQKR